MTLLNHNLEVGEYRFVDTDRYRRDPRLQKLMKYYINVLVEDFDGGSQTGGSNDIGLSPVFNTFGSKAVWTKSYHISLTTFTTDGIGAPGMNTDVTVTVTTYVQNGRSYNFFYLPGFASAQTYTTWELGRPETKAAALGIDYMMLRHTAASQQRTAKK
jgi:hypothetical protein